MLTVLRIVYLPKMYHGIMSHLRENYRMKASFLDSVGITLALKKSKELLWI